MTESSRFLRLARAFSLPFFIVALHFGVFFLARVALLLGHPDHFAKLSRSEILWAFLRGFRFDGAIIFVAIGVPVFLLMLPFDARRERLWRGIWGWSCFVTLLVFSLILASDDVYFGFVGRHVGVEINSLRESIGAVALTGAVQYPLLLVGAVVAASIAFFGWRRLLRASPPPRTDLALRIGIAVLCMAPIYLAAKGNIGGKRLKVVQAFDGVHDEAAAYLVLNGPFSILHSLESLTTAKVDYYPWAEALKTVQTTLFAPGETAVPGDYPLLRARPESHATKPNVVLIMLESWDAIAVDAHRREIGLEPLGLTPNYDSLSRQGVLLSRFYASGQRSMDGMSALLAGLPTLPRIPYLGRGVEQSGLPFLGGLARQEGYETLFIQSSKRTSFRNDAIAARAGFELYEGAEDVPANPDPVSRASMGGEAWDDEMFAEAGRRLAVAKRPFLAFLYTANTHPPYTWPTKAWEKFQPDSSLKRYWNSIAYADWALGQFFAGAKRDGYFDSTIFIITADHVGGPRSGDPLEPPLNHLVPGLIVAPGLEPGVDPRIGSQLDVIPTIAELAGWGAPQSALGRSLFSDAPGRGALCVEGELLLRIEPAGFVLDSLDARLRSSAQTDEADAMEKRLLSLYQVAATLTRSNRLYPPDGDLAAKLSR